MKRCPYLGGTPHSEYHHDTEPWTPTALARRLLTFVVNTSTMTSNQRPDPTIRVLLLESIHGSADELLGDHQFHVERVAGALGEDELVTRVGRVHLLGVRSKTRVTARVLDAAPHLLAGSLLEFLEAGATTGAVNFPQLELPRASGTHRILNVHRNVPGVIRDVSALISARGASIHAQTLATDATIGYLAIDVDAALSDDVEQAIAALPSSIATRSARRPGLQPSSGP